MSVNASGGQGNDFPAPSNSKRVAPDLIRDLVPTMHRRSRNNQIQMPAALALAALLAFPAAEVVAQEKPAAEQRTSVLTDLTVAPDGKVIGCEVKESSGYPALDAQACETLTAKGRFKPISGSVQRQLSQRISFVLTDEPAPSPAAPQPTVAADAKQEAQPSTNRSQIMRGKTDFDRAMQDPEQNAALAQFLLDWKKNIVTLQYVVDRDGNLESCEIIEPSVHPELDAQACERLRQGGQQAWGKKPGQRKIAMNWSNVQQPGGGSN